MRKLTPTLLASAAIAMPALAPAMAQNNKQPQLQPQAQQQQQPNQHHANQSNGQQGQHQANQNNGQQNQQQADNQPIPSQQLGRSGVKQIQQALDKDGFKAGRTDGVYGRETRSAVRDFQKSKGMQGSGQINQQTLSDLGVNVATNENNQNSDHGGNNNQNGNDNPAPK